VTPFSSRETPTREEEKCTKPTKVLEDSGGGFGWVWGGLKYFPTLRVPSKRKMGNLDRRIENRVLKDQKSSSNLSSCGLEALCQSNASSKKMWVRKKEGERTYKRHCKSSKEGTGTGRTRKEVV